MVIREATSADAESISSLLRGLSKKFIVHELAPDAAEHLLASVSPESIEKYIRSGFVYHVAEIDGQLIGAVGVRDNSHLHHLFVAEPFQRKGVATKLWQIAMQACLCKGNPGEFTVNSSLYAVPLYINLGFVAESGPIERKGMVLVPMRLSPDPILV